jgi:hypothetical protein
MIKIEAQDIKIKKSQTTDTNIVFNPFNLNNNIFTSFLTKRSENFYYASFDLNDPECQFFSSGFICLNTNTKTPYFYEK